jgi:hypothetical protein
VRKTNRACVLGFSLWEQVTLWYNVLKTGEDNETALRLSWPCGAWSMESRRSPGVPLFVPLFVRRRELLRPVSTSKFDFPPSITVFHPLPQAKSSFLTWLFKVVPLVARRALFLSNLVTGRG